MSSQRAQERYEQLRSTGRVEIHESLRHQAEHRDKAGQRLQTSSLSWSDIEAVTGQYVGGRWPSKGAYTVFLHLGPAAYARYHEGLGPMARRLEKANSRLFGAGSVALRRFQGGSMSLEDLLRRAHRDFGPDATMRRRT